MGNSQRFRDDSNFDGNQMDNNDYGFADAAPANRQVGKIRKLNFEKKFGFIAVNKENDSYFFHQSGLERTGMGFEQLTEGMEVEFTPTSTDKGARAIDIHVL